MFAALDKVRRRRKASNHPWKGSLNKGVDAPKCGDNVRRPRQEEEAPQGTENGLGRIVSIRG